MNLVKVSIENTNLILRTFLNNNSGKFYVNYIPLHRLLDKTQKNVEFEHGREVTWFQVEFSSYSIKVYPDKIITDTGDILGYERELVSDLYNLLINPFVIYHDKNGIKFTFNGNEIYFSNEEFIDNIMAFSTEYTIFLDKEYALCFSDFHKASIKKLNTVYAIGASLVGFHTIYKEYLNSPEVHEFIDRIYDQFFKYTTILLPCSEIKRIKELHDEFERYKQNHFPDSQLGFMSFLYGLYGYETDGWFEPLYEYLEEIENEYMVDLKNLYEDWKMRLTDNKDHFYDYMDYVLSNK